MRIVLLLIFAVTSMSFSTAPNFTRSSESIAPLSQDSDSLFNQLMVMIDPNQPNLEPSMPSLDEMQVMLHEKGPGLKDEVINKVMMTLRCSRDFHLPGKDNVITIIDYSLPSNEKRLWVFDLKKRELLFNTYVSHGITSGALVTNYFSNKYNSKASSIGVYTTDKSYYGREGLSLRLDGLERGFNDNASGRSVVMHGGWYMDEQFIKRYGRPGRSWGCPALPLDIIVPVVNTIKDKSLFVIYYPSDSWFARSKFLNCKRLSQMNQQNAAIDLKPMEETREEILFADVNRNNSREEDEPVAVVSADNYERFFHNKPPLERMLRRRIDNMEYIALSNNEFKELVNRRDPILNQNEQLKEIYFVIPVIKMVRGYYETEMRVVPWGKLKAAEMNSNDSAHISSYTVQFEGRTLNLKPTSHFIRWLGL